MNHRTVRHPYFRLASVIVVSLCLGAGLSGCGGGGNETVEVKFPDPKTLPPPPAVAPGKANASGGTETSQGDPSQFSRVGGS